MEPDVVTEVWVVIELRVPAVSSALPFHIPAKNVDNAVLDFLCHLNKVHIIPAAGRALDLRCMLEGDLGGSVSEYLLGLRLRRTDRNAGDSR